MIDAGLQALHRIEMGQDSTNETFTLTRAVFKAMLAAAPTPPHGVSLPNEVLGALRFYANGEHFDIDQDHQEFDTVSGEPGNWIYSQREEDTTHFEDGSIARAVLQGKEVLGEIDSTPVDGEIYNAAPAPEVENTDTDCDVVCRASRVDGVVCPHDSCDIEDGTRPAPEVVSHPCASSPVVSQNPENVSNKTPEPYAYAYERTDLPEEMREFYGPALHLKPMAVIPTNWTVRRLYAEQLPTSRLVTAAEETLGVLEYFSVDPRCNLYTKTKQRVEKAEVTLRAALDKEKP